VDENLCGLLTAAFRVLRRPINLAPDKAAIVTLASVYFHNYLHRNGLPRRIYFPLETFDEENTET
jgi:hypothetical protein